MFQVPQLNSSVSRELRVKPENLDRERHLIGDALAGSVVTGEKFKIVERIVLTIAVLVVNCLFGKNLAAKMFGHDVTMFKDGPPRFLSADKSRNGEGQISLLGNVSGPVGWIVFFRRHLAAVFVHAVLAAKSLLSVILGSSNGRVFGAQGLFAALLAGKFLPLLVVCLAAYAGAWNRAVKRFFAVLFYVGSHYALFAREHGFAVLADKGNGKRRFELRKSDLISGGLEARKATKSLSGISWSNLELCSAPFASLLDRHARLHGLVRPTCGMV